VGQPPQVHPEEILHGHEVAVAETPEIVDLDDVLVLEEGGDLGLVDEGLDHLRLGAEVGQDALDGDELLEALVAGDLSQEKLRHAADGDPFQQLVFAELKRFVHCGGGSVGSDDEN
jgi:hypothetical protein